MMGCSLTRCQIGQLQCYVCTNHLLSFWDFSAFLKGFLTHYSDSYYCGLSVFVTCCFDLNPVFVFFKYVGSALMPDFMKTDVCTDSDTMGVVHYSFVLTFGCWIETKTEESFHLSLKMAFTTDDLLAPIRKLNISRVCSIIIRSTLLYSCRCYTKQENQWEEDT